MSKETKAVIALLIFTVGLTFVSSGFVGHRAIVVGWSIAVGIVSTWATMATCKRLKTMAVSFGMWGVLGGRAIAIVGAVIIGGGIIGLGFWGGLKIWSVIMSAQMRANARKANEVAAVSTPDPGTVDVVAAQPERVDVEPAAVLGPSQPPAVVLTVEPGNGVIYVQIPAFCQVEYSTDLQTWEFLGIFNEPATEIFGCDGGAMFFRGRAVRP